MKRRGAVRRGALVLLAAALGLGGALAPSSASASSESLVQRSSHWFGQLDVTDHELQEWETVTIASVEHPKKSHPLPFHSYLTAELVDCDGQVVQRRYGISRNEKRKGKAWASTGQVALTFGEGSGPYAKFVVSVHSKGRPVESVDVTRSSTFTLGCDGSFTRSSLMPEPTGMARPINADFSRSATALLASKVRFGKVVGKAKVGSTLRVRGAAAIVGGTVRPKSARCWSSVRVLAPAGKKWENGQSGPCNASFTVAPKVRFHTSTGKVRTRQRVGLVTEVDSGVTVGGHTYVKVTSLGRS